MARSSGSQNSNASTKSSLCETCWLEWKAYLSPLSTNHPADHRQYAVTVVDPRLCHLNRSLATFTRYKQPAPFPLWTTNTSEVITLSNAITLSPNLWADLSAIRARCNYRAFSSNLNVGNCRDASTYLISFSTTRILASASAMMKLVTITTFLLGGCECYKTSTKLKKRSSILVANCISHRCKQIAISMRLACNACNPTPAEPAL